MFSTSLLCTCTYQSIIVIFLLWFTHHAVLYPESPVCVPPLSCRLLLNYQSLLYLPFFYKTGPVHTHPQLAVGDMTMSGRKPTISLIHPSILPFFSLLQCVLYMSFYSLPDWLFSIYQCIPCLPFSYLVAWLFSTSHFVLYPTFCSPSASLFSTYQSPTD